MQTLNEHLNEGGTIYSYIEQERNQSNKWFKFWITLVVALSVIFLAVQTEIIYQQNKSITYLKQRNQTDSASNYNNELSLSRSCKSVTTSEKRAIKDSVMVHLLRQLSKLPTDKRGNINLKQAVESVKETNQRMDLK